jgi:predicted DNA-binding transcriptional regulator AlpA
LNAFNEPARKWMRLREVAAELGLAETTLRRYIRAGIAPPFRQLPSGLMLFDPAEVREWLDCQRKCG